MSVANVYFLPAADGANDVMVAARNQKEACERIRCSVWYFREYGGRKLSATDPDAVVALSDPTKVWRRANTLSVPLGTPRAWVFDG